MSDEQVNDMVTTASEDEWQFPGDDIFPWVGGSLHDPESRTWVRTLQPGSVYYGKVLPKGYVVEIVGDIGLLTSEQQMRVYGKEMFERVE